MDKVKFTKFRQKVGSYQDQSELNRKREVEAQLETQKEGVYIG